jgi:glycerate kinase
MMSFSMWQKLAAAMIENAVRCGLNPVPVAMNYPLQIPADETGNMSLFAPAFIHIVSGLHLCSGRVSL